MFMPRSSWLETAYLALTAGKEVCCMRTYKIRVFVPAEFLIEAKDEAEALEKVSDFYKGYYTKDFRDWIEPLVQPEDVK
jgi:hypothetical protein